MATGWAAPPGTDESWGDPITWAHRIEAVDKRKNSRQCRDDVLGIFEDITENPTPEALLRFPGRGVDPWRKLLIGMFQGNSFHLRNEPPKPLPRSLAPAGEASPAAAGHAADYAGRLPSRYRNDSKAPVRCPPSSHNVELHIMRLMLSDQ